jgi:LAO/AO transport system kinase
VVFTPEGGDEVQTLKSGLMEIGDIFVVNKADRPNADRFVSDLRNTLDFRYRGAEWAPPVVSTVASSGDGVDELAEFVDKHRKELEEKHLLQERRRQGLRNRIRYLADEKITGLFWGNSYIQKRFDGIFKRVVSEGLSPYEAAALLVESLQVDEKRQT